MVVNRRTFIVKKPHFEEAQALLKEGARMRKQVEPSLVSRVYASEFGPFDTIAEEVEYASLAAYAQLDARIMADPAVVAWVPAWFKRWNEVTEPGGSNELWTLAD